MAHVIFKEGRQCINFGEQEKSNNPVRRRRRLRDSLLLCTYRGYLRVFKFMNVLFARIRLERCHACSSLGYLSA